MRVYAHIRVLAHFVVWIGIYQPEQSHESRKSVRYIRKHWGPVGENVSTDTRL